MSFLSVLGDIGKGLIDPVGGISQAVTGHNYGWTGLASGAIDKVSGHTNPNVADPFAPYRQQYAQKLSDIWASSDISNTPGYQFSLQQGQKAVTRGAAASGGRLSSNLLYNLDKYTQGLAQQTWNSTNKQLATLSGATTGSPAAAGQLAQGNANNMMSLIGGGAGFLFGGPGGALAGSTLGNMFGGNNYSMLQGTPLGLGSSGIGSISF